MTRYSMESRTRKHVKGYGFVSFCRNPSKKYVKKEILDITNKTEPDALKSLTKK